jgi:hypothetical protein
MPSGLLVQGGDPPIAIAAVLAGEGDNGLRQPVLIVPLRRLIALGPPELPHQAARMSAPA